jgi:RNA polymerase sigma-B factor
MIRVPRDVQELNARLSITRDRLTRETGRSPTVQELANAAHAGVEQVLEALGAADAYRALSLDEPLGDGLEALDSIGGDDAGFERVEQRYMLRAGLTHLPAREREILHLRFYEGLTQREIAERVGVSQMHVSRILRDTLERLASAAA